MLNEVARIWAEVIGTQPAPRVERIVATGVVAVLVVLVRPTWRFARHAVTIAHEGGHAVAALLSGRRLAGIRLHSDSSGVTVSRGRPRGPGMVFTAASGYLAPAVLGLLAAVLLHNRHALAVLWSLVVLLSLMLLQIRNFRGLYSMLVAGAAVFAVSWWGSPEWQSLAAYLVTWFLLIAAPVTVGELQRSRSRGRQRTSDADQLARLTPLPAWAWVGIFLIGTAAAVAFGVWLLLPLPL